VFRKGRQKLRIDAKALFCYRKARQLKLPLTDLARKLEMTISGIGYAVWYQALRGLTATQAAVLQLLVPVIAAAGGVIFTDEVISLRFIIASVLVLGGIMMVVFGRYYLARSKTDRVSI